jgi:hypothetical protein
MKNDVPSIAQGFDGGSLRRELIRAKGDTRSIGRFYSHRAVIHIDDDTDPSMARHRQLSSHSQFTGDLARHRPGLLSRSQRQPWRATDSRHDGQDRYYRKKFDQACSLLIHRWPSTVVRGVDSKVHADISSQSNGMRIGADARAATSNPTPNQSIEDDVSHEAGRKRAAKKADSFELFRIRYNDASKQIQIDAS